MSGDVGFGRAFHVALIYEVLSHLDLGADAASLFRPSSVRQQWAPALSEAVRAAGAGALPLQVVALHTSDLETACVLLESGRLLDATLGAQTVAALRETALSFRRTFDADERSAQARLTDAAALAAPLSALRRALYGGRSPPPLVVIDAPALGPHGRGAVAVGSRVVAVSLAQPLSHCLWQIFHEEVHPVSDAELDIDGPRQTAAGAPGFAVHRRIEQHALDRGRQAAAALSADLVPAYDRWCARFAG